MPPKKAPPAPRKKYTPPRPTDAQLREQARGDPVEFRRLKNKEIARENKIKTIKYGAKPKVPKRKPKSEYHTRAPKKGKKIAGQPGWTSKEIKVNYYPKPFHKKVKVKPVTERKYPGSYKKTVWVADDKPYTSLKKRSDAAYKKRRAEEEARFRRQMNAKNRVAAVRARKYQESQNNSS